MDQNIAHALPIEERKTNINLRLVNNQSKMGNPNWRGHEIAMGAVCVVIVVACLIGVVASSVSVNTANRNLAVMQNKVENINNKNSNLKQEINELTSHGRLQKIANKYGLSLSNQNIRNVSK